LWELPPVPLGTAIPDAVVVIDKEFGVEQRIDYLKNLLPEPFGPQDLDVDERPGRAPPGLSFD
jgi:hypothetical protein